MSIITASGIKKQEFLCNKTACVIIYGNMDFEERERRRRRQLLKVIIAEVGMTISVVAIVVVATLAAMGFFVTSSGKIEQSGLIQIHSMPTGATVEIDGGTVFSRTNLSRSLTSGEHNIKLSREGYDSWQKAIKMSSGMLLRLYYPRLFLLGRSSESVLRLEKELEFYSPSNDQAYILYAPVDSFKWNLINIRDEEPRVTQLDLSTILLGVVDDKFSGKIDSLEWSNNSNNVLIKVTYEQKSEWILIDLIDVKKSLNLTRTFGLDFTQVEMIDDGAAQLFALENQHLRRINTGDQSISRVLLDNIVDFKNSKTNVIYVMEQSVDNKTEKKKGIGAYRDGEKGGTVLAEVADDKRVSVALTHYYDEDYLVYAVENELNVYYGAIPNYRDDARNTDFSSLKILIDKTKLKTTPSGFQLSPDGEYIVASHDRQFMVIDLEMGELFEYEAMTSNLAWLDEAMMTAVVDDSLWVWDFDYTNQREMVRYIQETQSEAENDAEINPVTTISQRKIVDAQAVIAENDRWLYYLTENKSGLTLERERIRD